MKRRFRVFFYIETEVEDADEIAGDIVDLVMEIPQENSESEYPEYKILTDLGVDVKEVTR